MSSVDVIVVSYNSRETLRRSVAPLIGIPGVRVIVVDNASSDRCLDVIADLPVDVLPQPDNRGFAHACNIGIRAGEAGSVLLLNPDASIDGRSLASLEQALTDPRVGAAAPRILDADGRLDFSLRRFPRARTSVARAVFLHRVFPRASWADEVIRDERVYASGASPEWVSGACVLVRRSVLERLGGLDEGFFLYSEDTDLCRRIRAGGFDIRYVPGAVAVHVGGACAPRTSLLPVVTASRVRYARKHGGRHAAMVERGASILESGLRCLLARDDRARAGHRDAFALALGVQRHPS